MCSDYSIVYKLSYLFTDCFPFEVFYRPVYLIVFMFHLTFIFKLNISTFLFLLLISLELFYCLSLYFY